MPATQHRLSPPTFFPVSCKTRSLSAYLGIHIYNRGPSHPPPRLLSYTQTSPFFQWSQDHTPCLRLDHQPILISDLKIYPSQTWISPHFSFPLPPHIHLTSTHLVLLLSVLPALDVTAHTQQFPCAYRLTVASGPTRFNCSVPLYIYIFTCSNNNI